MKNYLKISALVILLSAAITACSGSQNNNQNDSTANGSTTTGTADSAANGTGTDNTGTNIDTARRDSTQMPDTARR